MANDKPKPPPAAPRPAQPAHPPLTDRPPVTSTVDERSPANSPGTAQEPLLGDPAGDASPTGTPPAYAGSSGVHRPPVVTGPVEGNRPEGPSLRRAPIAEGQAPRSNAPVPGNLRSGQGITPATPLDRGGLNEAIAAIDGVASRMPGTSMAKAAEVLPPTPDGPLWGVQVEGHVGHQLYAPNRETAIGRYFAIENIVNTERTVRCDEIREDEQVDPDFADSEPMDFEPL